MDEFEQLYRENAPLVYGYLLRLTGDPGEAEELLQETFVRALIRLDGFRGDCRLSSWLCQIGKNLYLDARRRQSRQLPLEGAVDGAAAEDPALLRQEEREETEAIFRQVERLAEPGRTVFALHALQGLSLAEISRRYRRSESWARVLYYRAKRRIIAAMKEDGLDGL
ncbi:RNA polymerase sigma factor [Bittarella massiliensis (ex Durand et al. 2017)]|uniref:RNA polymerase sigma factor n=1 Tax=Bittarella massiliensis (ex Durand et al. 2017) TaxID=1720313 RepID=A0AAW5KIT8_9FIRM|nr:sigma-70 family RNA polymerase sigma factor [Bittarella massiliensis (ex Durand et al. 2017)]